MAKDLNDSSQKNIQMTKENLINIISLQQIKATMRYHYKPIIAKIRIARRYNNGTHILLVEI